MLTLLIVCLSLQTHCAVIKNNGDEIKISELVIHQSATSTSFDQLVTFHQGKQHVFELKNLKRVNLQESLGKKKGVTTWKALVVKRNDQKMEVKLDLIRISGTTTSGKKIELSASVIDKISF